MIENEKKYPEIELLKRYCNVFGISYQTFLLLEDNDEKNGWSYQQLLLAIMEALKNKENQTESDKQNSDVKTLKRIKENNIKK